jgi:hypothetical protein
MKRTKKIALIGAAVALPVLLGASSCDSESTRADRQATDAQMQVYQAVQPIPQFDWSQYRQTVLDVLAAQVNGVATTSFFMLEGVDHPIDSCPSIGFPMPSTTQITSPDQVLPNSGAVVALAEPNGTYTGTGTATYVVCVAPDGTKYVDYWEGYVRTKGGPAKWDDVNKTIVLTGPATALSTGEQK